MENYKPCQSFLRVASLCPEVAVADIQTNSRRILELFHQVEAQGASLAVTPELSITGYTLGDLVNQNVLLNQAREGLEQVAKEVQGNTALIVGLPLQVGNSLYNCAAVLADGEIKGIIPKQNLPTYGEFYEDRWYQKWNQPNTEIQIGDKKVPFGTDMTFDIAGVQVGVEICEDLWVANPPSNRLSEQGALIIANPSASPEQVGREEYRRELVANQSGRLIAGYVYAGCHSSESTMDIVMGGHQLVAANGQVIAERLPFGSQNIILADIDVEHLLHDRRRQGFVQDLGALVVPTTIKREQTDVTGRLDKNPFLPDEAEDERGKRLDKAVQIQAYGLAERIKNTSQEKLVLGLSGGLDSTLALLVAIEAARILGKKPAELIRTITMPGPASSHQTQSNAHKLANALGIPNETIPINDMVTMELSLLGHDGTSQDITYENVQARARTTILFNYGNKNGCMVLGTGDLSEIALGWCTYNADHMSHYNVNASIPKTMVRHLVAHLAKRHAPAEEVIDEILGTPISPELTTSGSTLTQETEDIIGPYALHDFFLYHHIRWGDTPAKIAFLAKIAFQDDYRPETVDRWMEVYFRRFAGNQFKRSVMPDGPKVGSVALSPRGDWRMPSDMPAKALWK